jgi:hypothetical protein
MAEYYGCNQQAKPCSKKLKWEPVVINMYGPRHHFGLLPLIRLSDGFSFSDNVIMMIIISVTKTVFPLY